ncbi:MAG: hypothetical protein NVSMB62_23900 [Acidobacteriaceae bacterium]
MLRLLALLLFAPFLVAQQLNPYGAYLDGRAVPKLAPSSAKAVVLFFIASDCPISNRTFPEMKRLRETYAQRGVRFWFVYPNATEKPADVRTHQQAFDPADIDFAITDPDSALTRLTHARVTPEAAILLPEGSLWRPVYTGRIDDRFVRIGLERPAPTQLLADRALNDLLAGRPVSADPGNPIGCAIFSTRTSHP